VVAQWIESLGGPVRLGQSLLGVRGSRISREVFERRSLEIQGRLTRQALGRVRPCLAPEQPVCSSVRVSKGKEDRELLEGRWGRAPIGISGHAPRAPG
jgi:hypothetical protein